MTTCPACNGTGFVPPQPDGEDDILPQADELCPKCNGTGVKE
jgi:DnaJ-class molecular chaperone